jgi:DNA replication ATP-dependent helicase Dna2
VAELQRLAESTLLVATTSLGLTHPLLTTYRSGWGGGASAAASSSSSAFAYVLLDECSQQAHPVTLGALRFLGPSGSFILVGDHHQLPPLVRSPMAQRLGMGVSLFQSLCTAHPHAVSTLATQYRMSEPIMQIANDLVYKGALRCANESVRTRQLHIPAVMRMREVIGVPRALADGGPSSSSPSPPSLQLNLDWLAYVINPAVPVVFLDTSAMHAADSKALAEEVRKASAGATAAAAAGSGPSGISSLLTPSPGSDSGSGAPPADRVSSSGSIRNPVEAALSCMLLHALAALGVPVGRLGFISPYRAQLTLMRAMLGDLARRETQSGSTAQNAAAGTVAPSPSSSSGAAGLSCVECSTVDRFQGRDADVVLLSLVRSNSSGDVGALLSDWRRINVAVTRARAKLVVLGDSRTLKQARLLAQLLDQLAYKQQIYSLPTQAHRVYPSYAHMHALMLQHTSTTGAVPATYAALGAPRAN